MTLQPPTAQHSSVLYTSQATACRGRGEALALQLQANYGGARKFLRLWILSEDPVADKQDIIERTIADYVPNESSLLSLARDARKWATGTRTSLLIADREMVSIVLSPEFALGAFDIAQRRRRIIDSREGLVLQKPMKSFPDDTVLVLGAREVFENGMSAFQSVGLPIASNEVQAWMERSSVNGPVGLLHIRASVPPESRVRSGVSAIQSDQGLVKDANEDSATIISLSRAVGGESSSLRLITVADGVGGAAYGELASKIASSAAPARVCRRFIDELSGDTEAIMNSAFEAAHQRVEKVAAYANKSMASTLTMSLILKNQLRVAHAGDTRAYEVDARNETVRRLTEDHRLSQNGVASHVITRAVGSRNPVPDIGAEEELHEGNILLICTDGLHDLVKDEEILDVCALSRMPDELNSKLVDLANSRGGNDNITVAVHYM